jgi:tRNA (adenine-N(1)-)-methyltransferase non-catalytic subunit
VVVEVMKVKYKLCLTGTGYVCNTYAGGSPYPMDIARIFNFGNEICKR